MRINVTLYQVVPKLISKQHAEFITLHLHLYDNVIFQFNTKTSRIFCIKIHQSEFTKK